MALGKRGEVGSAGQSARDQSAHIRFVVQQFGCRGQFAVRGESFGQTVENVGAARLIEERRRLGDALEERRHAGLSSCPDA